ncbi:mitogen-activated protein kinase kinase kinase 4 isoform X3 [Linepithema humile]|uniref:mitogen-activated protein kinase kinase kinase 4 isoform X3 n=1 Tax=Linepithema humile TaxID=83485 RepID=UPI00351E34B0
MSHRVRSSHVTKIPGCDSTDDEDVDCASKVDMSSPTSEFEESLHTMSDMYGQTPPRTRLSRKKRHMKQKFSGSDLKSMEKEARPRIAIRRRNTLDTIIFNEMCDKADKDRENEVKEEPKDGSRKCKRSLKLLRGNERDLKLDVEAAFNYAEKHNNDMTVSTPNQIKIETRNRFRCLRSKPVDVEEKRVERVMFSKCIEIEDTSAQSPRSQSFKEREMFHDTFSFLIKLGSTERNCRRQMSHEETRWQNELKDLIWLELQAHHADRSAMAQDEYLCRQREAVEGLITEIMEYRYDPIADVQEGSLGCISPGDVSSDRSTNSGLSPNIELGVCPGCLSMYCRACARAQGEALQQIEGLLARLEAAEALYPSSQAFAANYPLYKSAEFTDRVKAMCLWYNMTKHHRLKIHILGRLLMMLHGKKKQEESTDSGISSRSSDTVDSTELRQCTVRFEVPQQDETSSSPSDSNNSNNSSIGGLSFVSQSLPPTPETSFSYIEDERVDRLDFYLVEFDRHAYRKYIEDVLKTRGLSKSLNFLDRLHTSVLRKASLTLEKHVCKECNNDTNEEYEGDRELRRYGVWSPEAKELNLPSYRAAFLFLSRVPLDVVHEFLRMRLEQKPEQPSPLSVRQLMRELREGLRIACIHRDRFAAHSRTAVASDEAGCESLFKEDVKYFDESLRAVFEVYLDYLQQWVDMVQHDSFHKNLIMDEWLFVESIAGNISDGYKIAGVKFCKITRTMIKQVNEFLVERSREIRENAEEKEDDELPCNEQSVNSETQFRLHLMFVGREWQGMFVEAREKVVKSINLVNCLKRSIEEWSVFDRQLMESFTLLKNTVLDLRHRITAVIEDFQSCANEVEQSNADNDQSIMLPLRSRIREILHQAYRMGFDFHKELCKLFSLEEKTILARGLVSFALLWMEFVRTRCERGRGLRPRWANQGLEFLITVCEPDNTKHLTDQEFEELKTCMDCCISHVVGTVSVSVSTPETEGLRRLSRSRASSPCHNRTRTASFSLSQKPRDAMKSPELFVNMKKSSSPSMVDGNLSVIINTPERGTQRHERVVRAVRKVECELDERLRSHELIGQIIDRKTVDRVRIKARRVTFTWQRGIKIGQGRFGKVYTVVNNQTGELLAMKEVQLQPGDHRAIRRVAEELQIFEGIQHRHLVRYYGLEIHREEMLIFMEFCAEGTLESLVAGSGNGLPESLVRKYTYQLLSAVAALHSHGIVHRDIKTANIFLTDEGNSLKLGDFGSAVQIKAHTTMPGELQGFVGTQAYMAPEVFMKSESSGHGRAVDIWSVGCCIIEMASGRRPWSDYDSNYQIMFKVGMGETPALPKNLAAEGIDLVKKCLQHEPKKRPTANSLLAHFFARGEHEDNVIVDTSRIIVPLRIVPIPDCGERR